MKQACVDAHKKLIYVFCCIEFFSFFFFFAAQADTSYVSAPGNTGLPADFLSLYSLINEQCARLKHLKSSFIFLEFEKKLILQ